MTTLPDSATDLALHAFEARPTRAEALADLARHFRDRGMNELATMFAQRGLAIPPTDDLLFVESWARESLATDLSISGFYTRWDKMRERAHETCDELAISRSVSHETQQMAWTNLFYYTKLLREYAPSYQAHRIDFEPPDGYHPMNPSVCRVGDKMFINIRAVNYLIAPEGHYVIPEGDGNVRTRNFLVPLGNDLVLRHPVREILPPLGFPEPVHSSVLGFEDVRLFTRGDNELWCSATVLQLSPDGYGEIIVSRIDDHGRELRLNDWHVIHPDGPRRHEKNWMPIADGSGRFIYSCDPLRIIGDDGKTVFMTVPPVSATEWSGSSQVIPFRDGFLALVHERIARPGIGKRQYQRRFVWFDADINIRKVTHRFQFTDQSAGHEGGEFVCGMCLHPDGKRLVISHGLLDREAWLVTVDADEVVAMMRDLATLSSTPAIKRHVEPKRDISMDRAASPEEREAARRSSVLGLQQIDELLPSWRPRRLAFIAPDGFAAMAPSVINRKGRLLATVRCINYACSPESGYYRIADRASMGADVKPNSRTFMVEFDPETLADRTLHELSTTRVLSKPRDDARAHGFEDLIPFEWGTKLWAIAAFAEQSADGLPEQWLLRIDEDVWSVDLTCRMESRAGPRRAEKNWMPIVDANGGTPRFIYLCDPTTIIDYRGKVIHRSEPEIAAEHLHGGSQAVPFEGGWLAVVHWMQVMDEASRWTDFEYRNLFVWLDENFNLKRVSPAWAFPIDPAVSPFPRRFQIAHGLAWHPDGNRLIIGYEMYEREPWVGTVDADDVRRAMGFLKGDNMEGSDDGHLELEQTNRPLRGLEDVEWATRLLRARGLPECSSCYQKNWDTYLGIWHAVNACPQDSPILDAGGDRHSVFLPGMRALGYRNLINVNIDEPSPGNEFGINFVRGDITELNLPDKSQKFVMCQSVLEHNVDWRKFFNEMARIIEPGGGLFVSIDYWERSIYENVKIFDEGEVHEMVDYAARLGLRLSKPMDYTCRDMCVDWGGRKYTFINMLFCAS